MNDLIKIPVVLSKAYPTRKVNIGRQGENEYREVVVSTADFANGFEDYAFAIIYKRPDGITYPVSISISPDTISWIIKSYDVEVIGVGRFEIRLLSGDSIGKSTIIECVISPSLDGEELPPPAPAPDWLTEVSRSASDAMQSVEDKADTEIIRVGEAGGTQIIAVEAAGAEQIAGAKTEADRAKDEADRAAGEANDAEDSAVIAANNILNGVSTHNQDNAAHADIRTAIDHAKAIARGRATSLAFDTVEQLDAWIAGTYTREDGLTVEELQTGDNLYIRDVNVPDYWWDGEEKQVLEAEAPELVDYYTKLQVQMLLPILITRADYDALYAAGQIQADRDYDIIEAAT